MINKIIKDLKKKIEELQQEPLPEKWKFADYDVKELSRASIIVWEKEAKLQAYEDAQKIICEEIENKVNKIATDKRELALTGNKRACCMMTLNELLKKFQGESNE